MILYLTILSISHYVSGTDSPVRNTSYGQVRGIVTERLPGSPVEEYLGIPYAAPPIGDKRFEHPRKPNEWNGIKLVTELQPACFQGTDIVWVLDHFPGFNKSHQSEDCLYLNVYVPKFDSWKGKDYFVNVNTTIDDKRGIRSLTAGKKSEDDTKLLPVMLYVHGGSNRAGMGAMLPSDILAGYGKIIIVNFNYRLGVLGFLAIKDKNITGNYGLLDQVAAMRWVRDNIHNFGGDKDRVTIVGQSAGAGDVGLHLVSPLTKGLFRYAVIMSGSPLAHWAVADPRLPEGTNIDVKNPKMIQTFNRTKTFLKDIKNLSLSEIKDFHYFLLNGVIDFSVVYLPPVVDHYFLTERPRASFKHNRFHGDVFVLSFTNDESFPYVMSKNAAFPGFLKRYSRFYPNICDFKDSLKKVYSEIKWPGRRVLEAEGDIVFYSGMFELADIMSRIRPNASITLYDFAFWSTLSPQKEWQGVPHGRDLFYLFGVPFIGHKYFNYTENDVLASKIQMTIWSNFVKYGFLSIDGQHPVGSNYDKTSRTYTKLYHDGHNITLEKYHDFRESTMEYWNEVVPKLNVTCEKQTSSSQMKNTYSSRVICIIYIFICVLYYQ